MTTTGTNIDPASDPNNPANWISAGFPDGSSMTFDTAGPSNLNPLPTLPPLGGTQTPLSQGGASTGTGTVASAGSAATTASNPARITVTPSQYSGPETGSLSDYFLRAVIIILGFIFVAVGLNMFRPGIVPDPRNLAPRVKP